MKRSLWALLLPLLLAGCGVPTSVTVASLAVSGMSVVFTGKGLSDHTLSAFTKRDCALARVIYSAPLCQPRGVEKRDTASRPALALAGGNHEIAALATMTDFEAQGLSAIAPAAGESAWPESPWMAETGLHPSSPRLDPLVADDAVITNIDAVAGMILRLDRFPESAEVYALIQADGSLDIFVHQPQAPVGTDRLRRVARIIGYARHPEAFTDLHLNGRTYAIRDLAV